MNVDAPDLDPLLERLARARSEKTRRAWLARHPELRAPAHVDALYRQVLKLAYVDLTRAARFSQAASWLGTQVGDAASRAAGLRSSGHMAFARARYPEALESYTAALKLLEAAGPDLELEQGRTLATGLQVLIYLGRYDEAFQWAARARDIYRRHHDELRLARLTSNMGNILFRQDLHQDAIALYRQAAAELERLGEPRDLAAILSNMAVCYTSLSEFDLALQSYRRAREHCRKFGFVRLAAEADYNIAYLHYLRGEYRKAMDLYQQARVYCRENGDAYHEALCDLDESEMYLELNLSEEGGRLAESATRRFAKLRLGYERAKAVMNAAVAASQFGDTPRTVRLLRRARKAFVAEGNLAWPAVIDLYLALVYQQAGRARRAWQLSEDAYRFLSGSMLPAKAALCELLRARLLRRSGRHAEARAQCLKAAARLRRAGARALLFYAYYVLGAIEEDAGNLDAAYQAYRRARQETETFLSRLHGERIQVSFLKDKLAIYESLVALCLESGHTPRAMEESFQYIEEAKSRSLADLIACSPDREPAAQPSPAGRLRELRLELDRLYREMDQAALRPHPAGRRWIEHLRSRARERETALIQGAAEIRSTGREVAVLLGEGALSLDAIRAAIPPDAILLQYFRLRGMLCVCLLGHGLLRIVPLAQEAGVRHLLRLLQFQMSKFRLGPGWMDDFSEGWRMATETHLRELYLKVVAPVRAFLDKPHLIVAPQGFLHCLPFHALHDGDAYLLDRYSISYAPSGSVFALCAARQAAFEDRAVILGVPDARAPHIEIETRAIAGILPGARLFLGAQATKEVLSGQGHASRFVHIATHGMFRPDNPMFSSIRLGDGHLSLFDLYSLPLSSSLVTLSGCSTGLNVVVGADELFGLMRGLLSAGAHSVLVSLWDVSDRSTAEFMAAFYRNVVSHGDKARAVRDAMRSVREAWPHPFYWAPFVLVGKYMN